MSSTYSNVFKGRCHCGNIHVELHTNKGESDFVPRECQCSVCTKNGAHWIADPEGQAKLSIKDKDEASYYRYVGGTSDFVLCKNCGVMMIVLCETDDRLISVVNMKSMTEEIFTSDPIQTNFDGEIFEERMARRNKNWTGDTIVEFGETT